MNNIIINSNNKSLMNKINENNIRKSIKKEKYNELINLVPNDKNEISVLKMIKNEKTLNSLKVELDEKLIKLFSSQATPSGYNKDIESLLKDLYLTREDLFKLVLEFISKSTKKENEIRIIASYLFSMKGLTNLLLKTINQNESNSNKEKHLLNELLVLGDILGYEKFQKNSVVIRFGEKGSKAYINLSGEVAVLIKKGYRLLLNEEEYLYYLINLINYKEYELANITINENYKIFPVEIIDNIGEEDINKKYTHSMSIKDVDLFNFNKESIDYTHNFQKNSSKDISKYSLKKKKSKQINRNRPMLKLNQENKRLREISFKRTILASNLMKKFNLKSINKRILNKCSIEEYINRLNVIYGFNFDENQYNKRYQNYNDKFYFTIYSYVNIVNLKKGSIFGEMALSNKNSLRTATIIALDECHCGVLNKKTFNNCLKNGAEKNLYDILCFLVDLPIFKGIPQSIFYKKYYTSLSRNSLNKNNKIIIQGQKPDYLALLKSGQYTIYTYNSLYNITNLLVHYMTINQKIKKNDEKVNKIILSLKSTNKLLIENENFKNYYFSKHNFKVGEISCPDIIGYNEYLDENGKYAFTIEVKSIQSDFFLLKNNFFEDIMNKTDIVKYNQDEIYYSKLNLIIERLYNMRKIAINSFIEYKTNEKIGSVITKEIEKVIGNRIKYKRSKRFNSTNFNIQLIQNDNINNNNEYYFIDSIKKSSLINSNHSKIQISNFVSKEISKTENNINNINKKENTLSKFSKIPKKNNISHFNKTISNLRNYKLNHNLPNLKSYSINKSKNIEKEKIEAYTQKDMNTKKNEFDGICLNNMILEDIKDHIKFPLYETPKEKRNIQRNHYFKTKNMILSKRLYKSVKQNKYKYEITKSLPSLSENFLLNISLLKKIKDKKEKKNKSKFSYNTLVNEANKTNYTIGRNNYYEKNISKRLNYFFGIKK